MYAQINNGAPFRGDIPLQDAYHSVGGSAYIQGPQMTSTPERRVITVDESNSGHTNILDESDIEPKRRLTDRKWLLAFIGFLGACSLFVLLSISEGNPARLYKGMNYQGKTCGIDPDVRDLPYLYFPLDPRESFAHMMTNDGRCIDRCPNEHDVDNGMTIPTAIRETSIDDQKTSATTVEFLVQSPAYASSVMADAYCIPMDASLRRQLAPALNGTFRQIQMAFGSFVTAWGTIMGYSILAMILSYLLSYGLRISPSLVLGGSIIGTTIVCFVAGGCLIANGVIGVLDQDKGSFYSLDYTWALFFGVLLMVTGCGVGILLFMARRIVGTAVRVFECAADTIGDLQQIFLAPLIFSAASIVWISIWVWFYLYMVSAGTVNTTEIPMGLDQNGDIGILPLHRNLVYDARFILFGAIWWFALFWVLEAIIAFCHFVIAYSATVWYFSPPEGADERDVGWFPPLVAINLGTLHHIGSFAVGGLVMGATRPIRILFAWAASKHLEAYQNSPIVQSLKNSFQNVLKPIAIIVDRYSSSGFIEMSISSKSFFAAMDKSCGRITQARSPAAFLHGISSIFTATGTLFISVLIGLLTYSTLTGTEVHSNITSSNFVAAPLCVSAFTAIIAGVIAMQFLAVWDTVADTLMYCYLVESVQPPVVDENPMTKIHAPASLRELLLDAQRPL